MVQEETPDGIETTRISLSRRNFIKLLLTGGGAAVLTACGIRPEEEKEIPQVALDKLISNPDLYAEVPLLKTSGYPEQTGKKVISAPITRITYIDGIPIIQMDWVTTETDTYNLHTAPTKASSSIAFMTNSSTYLPFAPLQPSGSNLVMTDLYELTGKIGKVKTKEGNEDIERYMFQPSAIRKVESTTPQPTK